MKVLKTSLCLVFIFLFGSNIAYARNLKLTKPPMQGEDVRQVQNRLISKGYGVGKKGADSYFGKDTEGAVKRFQKDHGLCNDGIVGDKTKVALGLMTPRTMRPGDSGPDVKALQERLQKLGYDIGMNKPDSKYETFTELAVKEFQRTNHLKVKDGKAGPETLEKLYSPNVIMSTSGEWHYLGKRYRFRVDGDHNPGTGKPHIHIQGDGDEGEENIDGTPSHLSNGGISKFPKWVRDAVKNHPAVQKEKKRYEDQQKGKHKNGEEPTSDKGKEAEEIAKKAAVAAVAAAGGYVIYRGIRMLPSLLPPLWWTIPGNVVIP